MSEYVDNSVLLRAGTVCQYIFCICVCQGRYSVGTAGCEHRSDYVAALSKTIVNSRSDRLPSLCYPYMAAQNLCTGMSSAQYRTVGELGQAQLTHTVSSLWWLKILRVDK